MQVLNIKLGIREDGEQFCYLVVNMLSISRYPWPGRCPPGR